MGNFEILTKMMVKFEKGEMCEVQDIIDFAQKLVDNGLNVSNNGHYSQIVQELINKGKISKDPQLQAISWLKDLKWDDDE